MIVERDYPYKAVWKASRKILKGEEFVITYMHLLMPTFMRRKEICKTWHFHCNCNRYAKIGINISFKPILLLIFTDVKTGLSLDHMLEQ